MMGFFEQGAFLLDKSIEVVLPKCIPDCLACERVGNDVNEIGSLDTIIKLPSSDLVNKRLLVTRKNGQPPLLFSLSASTSLLILTMVDFPRPVSDWIM